VVELLRAHICHPRPQPVRIQQVVGDERDPVAEVLGGPEWFRRRTTGHADDVVAPL
jgi:hypothetical protein